MPSKTKQTTVFQKILITLVVIAALSSLAFPIIYLIQLDKPTTVVLPKNTGDIILYERELFAIGYATAKLEEEAVPTKSKYNKFKQKGQQIWDAAKVGETE